MARISGWSEREVDRRSTALARLLRRAWRAVSRAVSGSLREQPDALVTAASHVQPIWNEQVEGDVLGFIGDVYVDAAEDVLIEAGAPAELLIGEDLVQLYLRTATNRLRGVGDHAWERVRNQLLAGQRAGDPLDDIAARIAGIGGISDARALTIARTEVHAAAESAAWEQARYVDPDALKVWLATNDERTRATHRAAEGQAVSMNEFFVVGDSKLRFPGDPLGDPGETINCRCTLLFDLQPVLEFESEPEPADALVAAGKKWNPTAHPRGKDGRFIKKGAVQTLLAKQKPLLGDVAVAVKSLDQKQWDNLTDEQQDYITESVAKLPAGSQIKQTAENDLAKFQSAKQKSAAAKPQTSQVTVPKVTPAAPSAVDIPAHKGAAPGSLAKVSTALIWGKYEPGTTILEAPSEQITWNGKKYEHRVGGQLVAEWTKKDAYANLKNDSHWQVPGASEQQSPATMPEPDGSPELDEIDAPMQSGITGQSGMPITQGQAMYDKGLMTLDEFEDEFGLSPAGYVDPGPLPAPELTPTPAASWPDKVTISVPKNATGKFVPPGVYGGAGHTTQEQLDAAATKPANFNPNAGVQTGKSAFYVALQSHPYSESSDEWHALRTYQSHAATDGWNESLRKGVSLESTGLSKQQISFVKKAQPKLDAMMDASALPATVQVWRGMRDQGGKFAATLKKGTVFDDKAYVSTGTEKSVAESFAGPGGLLFDIEVPKGEKGLVPTQWTGRFLNEWELLLPRGSKFEVLEEPKKIGSHKVVKVRVVTGEYDDIKATPTATPAVPSAPAAPTPEASPQVPTPTPETAPALPSTAYRSGWSLTFDEGKKYLIDASHEIGTVVAESINDQERLVATGNFTAGGNQFYRRDRRNSQNQWVAVDSTVTGIGAIQIIRGLSTSTSTESNWRVPKQEFDATQGPKTGLPPLGDQLMNLLLSDWSISPTHAVALAQAPELTGAKWNELSSAAKTKLVSALDDAIDQGVPNANAAFKRLNDVIQDAKALSVPSVPTPATPVPTPEVPGAPIPSAPPAPVALSPTPATSAALSPTHVQSLKQQLKTGKVGYWSKPEAIWAQLQGFQQNYPQFTALQMLQALDSQLKTKEPSPFQTKMVKWLGTSKGAQAAAGTSVQSVIPISSAPSATPPPVKTPKVPKSPKLGSISHIPSDVQQQVYQAYKASGVNFWAHQSTQLNAAKTVASQHGFTVLQVLKIVDAWTPTPSYGKKKSLASKVTNWFKQPGNAATLYNDEAIAQLVQSGLPQPLVIPKKVADRVPPLPDAWDPNKLLPPPTASFQIPGKYSKISDADAMWGEVRQKYGDWKASQKSTLKSYTGTAFQQLNAYMWGTSKGSVSIVNRAKTTQAAMRPSTRPLRLLRATGYGVGGDTNFDSLQKKIGQTWQGTGFMSSSVGEEPGFAAGSAVWLDIEAPAGTPMAWVMPISQHPHEREMILAAGLHYKIIDVTQRSTPSFGTKTIVKVRVVPDPNPNVQEPELL